MDKTVFIGDYILEKEDHSGKTYFYFSGSEKIDDDNWKVNFSLKSHYLNDTGAIVGIGSNMYLTVSKGEKFRIGAFATVQCKKGQGMFGDKLEYKPVKLIEFQQIEKDSITISYE